jgi:PhnB protein
VVMPFGPTFWAKGFGMVTDRFGTPWMVGGGHVQPPQ